MDSKAVRQAAVIAAVLLSLVACTGSEDATSADDALMDRTDDLRCDVLSPSPSGQPASMELFVFSRDDKPYPFVAVRDTETEVIARTYCPTEEAVGGSRESLPPRTEWESVPEQAASGNFGDRDSAICYQSEDWSIRCLIGDDEAALWELAEREHLLDVDEWNAIVSRWGAEYFEANDSYPWIPGAEIERGSSLFYDAVGPTEDVCSVPFVRVGIGEQQGEPVEADCANFGGEPKTPTTVLLPGDEISQEFQEALLSIGEPLRD